MASKRRNTMLPDESTFASTGMGVYTPPERQLNDANDVPMHHPSNFGNRKDKKTQQQDDSEYWQEYNRSRHENVETPPPESNDETMTQQEYWDKGIIHFDKWPPSKEWVQEYESRTGTEWTGPREEEPILFDEDDEEIPVIEKAPETREEKSFVARLASKFAYTNDPNMIPTGYKYDRALSNRYIKVFHNPVSNHTITSYRGTQLQGTMKDAYVDLKSDLDILLGNFNNSDRIEEYNKHFQQVKDKYKVSKHLLVGHSLGSTSALAIARKNNVDSYSINTGHGLGNLDIASQLKYNIGCMFSACGKHEEELNVYDPISGLGHLNFTTKKHWYFDTKHIHSLPNKILY